MNAVMTYLDRRNRFIRISWLAVSKASLAIKSEECPRSIAPKDVHNT